MCVHTAHHINTRCCWACFRLSAVNTACMRDKCKTCAKLRRMYTRNFTTFTFCFTYFWLIFFRCCCLLLWPHVEYSDHMDSTQFTYFHLKVRELVSHSSSLYDFRSIHVQSTTECFFGNYLRHRYNRVTWTMLSQRFVNIRSEHIAHHCKLLCISEWLSFAARFSLGECWQLFGHMCLNIYVEANVESTGTGANCALRT